jgi:hypothetical protein
MSQTERMGARHPMQQRRVRPASPGQDGIASGRETRRLIEPLDESGAPVLKDTAAQDARRLDEAIRVRAYERYLQRQGRPGSAENDWLEAEREVRGAVWGSKDRPGNLST